MTSLYLPSCHLSVSMFSFQAIHNLTICIIFFIWVVIYQCQCSLFKQFTTEHATNIIITMLSFISVNVLFSSNSQHISALLHGKVSCHLSVSMFSFQAIHNRLGVKGWMMMLSFISVNVLFSSNSQRMTNNKKPLRSCHLSVSMFSFQAIHNCCHVVLFLFKLSFISVNVLFSSNSQLLRLLVKLFNVVIYQCQCSLFKQFTTPPAPR